MSRDHDRVARDVRRDRRLSRRPGSSVSIVPEGQVREGPLDAPSLMRHDAAVLLYGLRDKGEVFDLFLDQAEAEFALLDVLADEPDLADDQEVVEIEARIVRVIARDGGGPGT